MCMDMHGKVARSFLRRMQISVLEIISAPRVSNQNSQSTVMLWSLTELSRDRSMIFISIYHATPMENGKQGQLRSLACEIEIAHD